MRAIMLILATVALCCAAERVQRITTTDGRTIIGIYDREAGMVSVWSERSSKVTMRVPLAPIAIASVEDYDLPTIKVPDAAALLAEAKALVAERARAVEEARALLAEARAGVGKARAAALAPMMSLDSLPKVPERSASDPMRYHVDCWNAYASDWPSDRSRRVLPSWHAVVAAAAAGLDAKLGLADGTLRALAAEEW